MITRSRAFALGASALGLVVSAVVGVLLFWPRAPHFATPQCQAAFERFYREPVSRWVLVFGYKDARPARYVADRYERAMAVQRLMASGFERVSGDDELLTRSIRGPDGRRRTIELRVVASSAGPDDELNRRNPYQAWLSSEARRLFLTAIREADAVFYNGHSRTGGGPDFAPPRLLHEGSTAHVDYTAYAAQERGLDDLLEALRARSGARVLGLYSCASTQHFARRIREARPKIALVTSPHLLYFADALEQLLATIESLSKMKCQPDWSQAGISIDHFW